MEEVKKITRTETGRSGATEQDKDADGEQGETLQEAGGQNGTDKEVADWVGKELEQEATGGVGERDEEENGMQVEHEATDEVAERQALTGALPSIFHASYLNHQEHTILLML